MRNFFFLEGAYIILAIIILAISIFVGSRKFMPKGSVKKGFLWTFLILLIAITTHYNITTSRMKEVKRAFNDNKTIICESRMQRKVAQTVNIKKSNGWVLKNNNFISKFYSRPFFSARCIVK